MTGWLTNTGAAAGAAGFLVTVRREILDRPRLSITTTIAGFPTDDGHGVIYVAITNTGRQPVGVREVGFGWPGRVGWTPKGPRDGGIALTVRNAAERSTIGPGDTLTLPWDVPIDSLDVPPGTTMRAVACTTRLRLVRGKVERAYVDDARRIRAEAIERKSQVTWG